MKRTLLAIGLITIAGIANAGGSQSLKTVSVSQGSLHALDCTPPNSSSDCAALHAQIRANFSARQIGMLFGAAASYPEYNTAYERTKVRYDALVSDFAANISISGASAVASR